MGGGGMSGDGGTPHIIVGVLGDCRLREGDRLVPPPTRQAGRVATLLAGWPEEVVERDRIVAALWSGAPPATATNTLQVHVSHLRKALGKTAIRSVGRGYLLDIPKEAIDAEVFTSSLVDAARARRNGHFETASRLLTNAVGLWRGTPYPDLDDEDLIARRARLEEMRDTALEDLLECRLESARDAYELAPVIGEAKELVRRRPLRERGHVLLIRALTSADRAGEASVAFEQAAAEFRASSGLDPGQELTAIYGRCLQRDPTVLPAGMRRVSVREAPSRRVAVLAQSDDAFAPVRSVMVDIGARFVTQVEGDVDRRGELAAIYAEALAPDMATGVVEVSQGLLSASGDGSMAEQVVAKAVSGRNGSSPLSQLLVILNAEDGAWARSQAEKLLAIPEAPFILVLSPTATALPGEYLVTAGETVGQGAA